MNFLIKRRVILEGQIKSIRKIRSNINEFKAMHDKNNEKSELDELSKNLCIVEIATTKLLEAYNKNIEENKNGDEL